MLDLRKILIIAIIAVLYVVLAFAVTRAVYESPKYEDYCNYYGKEPMPMYATPEKSNCTSLNTDEQSQRACSARKGYVEYNYDSRGCPVSQFCNTCQSDFDEARKVYDFWLFIVFSILGLIGIVIGLNMSPETNELHKWVGTGFIAGGLAVIFTGTGTYYQDMLRRVRPFVILAEIAIVIYVFYKEMDMYRKMKESLANVNTKAASTKSEAVAVNQQRATKPKYKAK